MAGHYAVLPESQLQSVWRCRSREFCRSAGQCAPLTRLDLGYNQIGAVWEGRLQTSWRDQASSLVLEEDDNDKDEDEEDEEEEEEEV